MAEGQVAVTTRRARWWCAYQWEPGDVLQISGSALPSYPDSVWVDVCKLECQSHADWATLVVDTRGSYILAPGEFRVRRGEEVILIRG